VPATGIYFWNGSSWVQLSSGGLSGSGTINQVTKWTASNAVGNSIITDDGTNVGIGATVPGSKLEINAGDNDGLRINNGTVNGVVFNTSNTSMTVGTVSNHPLSFFTNNTRKGGIDQTGNVQINTLAGTGNRPVFANASGTLLTGPPPSITTAVNFIYTGADQTFTVPAGVFFIQVDLYGAAGGNGSWGGWTWGWSGGAGGYTHGTIAVTPGQVLTVMVGQGGAGGATSNATFSYGGGGRNCTSNDCQYAAKGGGRSAIRTSGGTELLTAGGGGGGGSSVTIGISFRMNGGAGGGLIGGNSVNDNTAQIATGGTQTTGGVGMTGNVRTGTNGSQFTGGTPGGAESYGGGGGGGWYGGGGGNYGSAGSMGGGAGGSGYISGPGVTDAWTQTGGGSVPEGGSAGIGTSNWPYFGRNGQVIISY